MRGKRGMRGNSGLIAPAWDLSRGLPDIIRAH
jgi:hypothetical protein